MTENGELFLEICMNNNLVIGGTLFPHKKVHKVTWISPDNVTENQIDHIAISRKWRGSLLDVRNKRGADCGSDHHLLIGTIRLKVAAIRRADKAQRKYNVDKLKNPTIKNNYIDSLNTSLQTIPNNTVPNWNTIKTCFTNAAHEHIGYKEDKRKQWISDNTWDLISERRDTKGLLNTARTRNEKANLRSIYSTLDKNVKKSARQDKRKWIDDLAKEAETAAATHRTRDLYRIAKKLTQKSFVYGDLVTSQKDQMDVWVEHYSSMLSKSSNTGHNLCDCIQHSARDDISTDCPESILRKHSIRFPIQPYGVR
ncbi:uncharacterized protein LOC135963085 [Calliphora vicina]|uniref:uncharacterized protein LOC135963085 n=1 Tax=Calliphora vicina TaxID=7373 RepID=UPI00325B54E3